MCPILAVELSMHDLFIPKLVIDKGLHTLPRRRTDSATIIRAKDSSSGKARVFKLNATLVDPIMIERYAVYSYEYPYSTSPQPPVT